MALADNAGSWPQLEVLHISPLSDAGSEAAWQLFNAAGEWRMLQKLNLGGSTLDTAPAAAMADAGRRWHSLQCFELGVNSSFGEVPVEAVQAIAAAAPFWPGLQRFCLAGYLGEPAFTELCSLLAVARCWSSLQDLQLPGGASNREPVHVRQALARQAASALAASASSWRQLRQLRVPPAVYGVEGAALLASCEPYRQQLTTFYMVDCALGPGGVQELARYSWPQLQELSIPDNGIGLAGVQTLAAAAACWPKLDTLWIGLRGGREQRYWPVQ